MSHRLTAAAPQPPGPATDLARTQTPAPRTASTPPKTATARRPRRQPLTIMRHTGPSVRLRQSQPTRPRFAASRAKMNRCLSPGPPIASFLTPSYRGSTSNGRPVQGPRSQQLSRLRPLRSGGRARNGFGPVFVYSLISIAFICCHLSSPCMCSAVVFKACILCHCLGSVLAPFHALPVSGRQFRVSCCPSPCMMQLSSHRQRPDCPQLMTSTSLACPEPDKDMR